MESIDTSGQINQSQKKLFLTPRIIIVIVFLLLCIFIVSVLLLLNRKSAGNDDGGSSITENITDSADFESQSQTADGYSEEEIGCGDIGKLPPLEFMSSDEQISWTEEEIDTIKCFLSGIYPYIVEVSGEPYNVTRTLKLDKAGEYLSYHPSDHSIKFALSGTTFDFDYDTKLSLTHEFIHSFNGDKITRTLLEEGKTEVITSKFYPRKNAIDRFVIENYEYLKDNNVFLFGDSEIHEYYRYMPLVELLKLEYVDEDFFKNVNRALYTDENLNAFTYDPLVKMLINAVDVNEIEGISKKEYIKNLFLSRDLAGKFCEDLCTFVIPSSNSIVVYVLKYGEGSYTDQFPVAMQLFDYSGKLLVDESTTTNDGFNSYNLVEFYGIPEEKQRYRLEVEISDVEEGDKSTIRYTVEYCPAYEDGLSGVIGGEYEVDLHIVGTDFNKKYKTQKGCFYISELREYRGPLEISYIDKKGNKHSRDVLKVVPDYAVVIQ